MATPKRKTSRSKTKTRRTHKKLPVINTVTCSNCGELKLPHQVCAKCGYYRGKQIISTEDE